MNANMSSAIVEKTYKMIKNPKKSEIVVSNVGVSAAHEVTHIRVAGKKLPFTIPLTLQQNVQPYLIDKKLMNSFCKICKITVC
jgi:hypothetical protein